MIRGLHFSASGMMAQMTGQEVIANNLANANTNGYKRESVGFAGVLSDASKAAPTATLAPRTAFDFASGPLQPTDSPLSLALEGDGFFSIDTPNGPAYTRDGAFRIDAEGYLATSAGNRVLGESGPIRLSSRGDVSVNASGVVVQGGSEAGRLRIAQFGSSDSMQRIGDNLWMASENGKPATETRVRQGFIEGSNVNSIHEMVAMIAGLRAYEANQKVVQAQDETLDKLVNDVGRAG